MVKLRVRVGGSYTDLAIVNCNDELHPIEFDGPEFKGRAMVEGRFKREWDGQQVYFGTDFDRSVELPDGFDIMFKIARYIDPVVKTSDSQEGKPWILSPLVSSINTLSAWRPQDAKLPSPPLTPRPSMDISRSYSMSEGGAVSNVVSSAWGFLGKFKRGNRSSVMSISSVSSNSDGNTTNGSSQEDSASQTDASKKLQGSISSASSSTEEEGGLQTIAGTPVSTPSETFSKSASLDENEEMPLGVWRERVDEDTTFFLPNKSTLTTSQRRKHFQSEQNRKDFVYRTDMVHGFEFFSPHMDFNTYDIRMGLSMNIRRFLAGQPVRYSCRTLDGETVFWAVAFELVD
ncbi:hypothetical protein BGW38_002906 [Lunasporangiospora selenospora]|uniref:Domain of unknown function at the cortex 1 domain-containing protein n=1 Tax=Lunasporangiospora selenospora TaxID=979761 RepID=A0A9P6G2X0_9FUNG|nr:hypothetical protein BGW38_002906 [Lunasporangiospora selenospora]